MQKPKETKQPKQQVTYRVGDIVELWDKTVVIVEVLEEGKYHVKNQIAPFDSFFTEIGPITIKEKDGAS